jgi:ribonuclease HI
MIQIAIDGASKNNGKPGCIASGGAAIRVDKDWYIRSHVEHESTSQRGEMHALREALQFCIDIETTDDIQIVTDSEYIFNTITKEWYKGWESRGWRTSLGDPVKNKELWQHIIKLYNDCATPPLLYHIKGHILPDGGDSVMRQLGAEGPSCVFELFYDKFSLFRKSKQEQIIKAQELSLTNNGFMLEEDIFRTFVALNSVADRIAVRALIEHIY